MPGPLPQKTKNTKRADDWRKQWAKTQDLRRRTEKLKERKPVKSPWKTSKRREPAAPPNSFESFWARRFRLLNEPTPVDFVPTVKLDPSQVDDQRAPVGIIGNIARWWVNQATTIDVINYKMPRYRFPENTDFGQLQRAKERAEKGQPSPGPTPAPSPSRIANPGLLSKYRR